jgi:hypothetical protein
MLLRRYLRLHELRGGEPLLGLAQLGPGGAHEHDQDLQQPQRRLPGEWAVATRNWGANDFCY